jgi:hypothetical protein
MNDDRLSAENIWDQARREAEQTCRGTLRAWKSALPGRIEEFLTVEFPRYKFTDVQRERLTAEFGSVPAPAVAELIPDSVPASKSVRE